VDWERTAWERSISAQIGSQSLVGVGSMVTLPRGEGGSTLPELEEGWWRSCNKYGTRPWIGWGREEREAGGGGMGMGRD
jgi:hypothetical protein